METIGARQLPLPIDDEWLVDLIGARATRVLKTFAAPCLHFAHWEALAGFWRANWTNLTTYGIDRYHCFCHTFGETVESFLPQQKVHQPTDRLGTPFTIEGDNWLVYPWRYGDSAADRDRGIKFVEEKGIRSRLVVGEHADQLVLDYPDLPQIELSRVVILAWAGNFENGLERAFLGRPYLKDGLLDWHETAELDLEIGRDKYAAPPSPDTEGVDRHGQVLAGGPFDPSELADLYGIVVDTLPTQDDDNSG